MSTARAASWAWTAAVLWTAAASHALSLRSTRAEAFLGEVRPGGRVSWSRALGAPYGVENTGGEPASVRLELAAPPAQRLLDGYEPLPDLGWARVETVSHALEPGAGGETDITVAVPKDRSLEGRQFQLECAVVGRAPDGSALTLRTRLLLAVGDGDPPERPLMPAQWAFEASPRTVVLPRVEPGRTSPLTGPGFTGVKLANAGESDATVRIAAVRVWPEGVVVPSGHAPAPNPRWLSGGPPIRVPAGTVRTAPLSLTVPKDPRYRGKKWAFLLAVDAESNGRVGRTWVTVAVSVEP
ncbi:MAG: hypothetical protein SF051_00030 [Elusimicrobiota bacterium]|nr:hypothetical protein [Elusimicrobiota bacterium]